MSRYKAAYQEFRNINIQAELVEIAGKLAVRLHVAALAPTPTGMRRFGSEQHVSLDNFIDGLRAENGNVEAIDRLEAAKAPEVAP